MRRRWVALAAACAVLAPAPVLSAAPAGVSSYVVMLAAGTGDPAAVAAEQATVLGFTVDHVYRSAITGFAADLTAPDLAALRRDPRVVVVEPDRPLTRSEVTPPGIDRIEADMSVSAAIDGADRPRIDADVAVLDTGIDKDHPDLNVVGGVNCAKEEDEDHPRPGYDDVVGHGTHISGIIGALDDGHGVVGVAPGVRLWAVRVLNDQAGGTTKELLCGVDWLTSTRTDSDPSNDIDVANLSLGGYNVANGQRLPGDDGHCGHVDGDLLHRAICKSVAAGVTYVVAAGNDGRNADEYTPAAYDEVITVSALADSDGRPGGLGGAPSCRDDVDDTLANFSNYGPDVDLIAPGVCILSTVPPNGRVPNTERGYGLLTGTSFAAPHVAGAAALFLAGHPGAGPAQVRQALIAAGSPNWDADEDLDGTKEPLLDVAPF
ncbi:MAG: S8 family serine peptidase [Acidimicrobiia bacterium]